MPQVDLGKIFPSAPATSDQPPGVDPSPPEVSSVRARFLSGRNRIQFSGAQWANISFVATACLGALFCGIYFFNGGELLWSVAQWPGALFNRQPHAMSKAAENDSASPGSFNTETAGPGRLPPDAGDPFASCETRLNYNPSPSAFPRPKTSPSSEGAQTTAPSPLHQLSLAQAGSDTLSRSLQQSSTESEQSAAETEQSAAETERSAVESERSSSSQGNQEAEAAKEKGASSYPERHDPHKEIPALGHSLRASRIGRVRQKRKSLARKPHRKDTACDQEFGPVTRKNAATCGQTSQVGSKS